MMFVGIARVCYEIGLLLAQPLASHILNLTHN